MYDVITDCGGMPVWLIVPHLQVLLYAPAFKGQEKRSADARMTKENDYE